MGSEVDIHHSPRGNGPQDRCVYEEQIFACHHQDLRVVVEKMVKNLTKNKWQLGFVCFQVHANIYIYIYQKSNAKSRAKWALQKGVSKGNYNSTYRGYTVIPQFPY